MFAIDCEWGKLECRLSHGAISIFGVRQWGLLTRVHSSLSLFLYSWLIRLLAQVAKKLITRSVYKQRWLLLLLFFFMFCSYPKNVPMVQSTIDCARARFFLLFCFCLMWFLPSLMCLLVLEFFCTWSTRFLLVVSSFSIQQSFNRWLVRRHPFIACI